MRKLIFLFSFFGSLKSDAQNLFANPGFEDINVCVEYHASCAAEAWFNIPATVHLVKGRYAQRPVLGRMLMVLPVGSVLPGFNEKSRFVYTMLTCPLVKDEKYSLSFYITAPGRVFEKLDFYFSEKEPTVSSFNAQSKMPTFTITEQHIDAAYNTVWSHVKYEFTARENAKFCVIGNFSPLKHVYDMKDAMNASGDIFYFIDEMTLKPLSGNLCPGYNDNIKKVYAQDYRHTNDITIAKDEPVVTKKPQFKTDTITIPSVLFDVNSAVIKPAITRILDSVINKVSKLKVAKIEINGHTDNTGTIEKNETLSISRAESVKKYLAGKLPGLSEQLFVKGKGQEFPIDDNKTELGRSRNRRVEIILTLVQMQN